MERLQKEYEMLRFAACLMSIVEENKLKAKDTGDGKIRKSPLVTSLRKLAASSGIDYATIQKIATGKKNPAWSTTVALIEGLGMNFENWGSRYDKTKEKDVAAFKAEMNIQKNRLVKPRGKRKS